MAVNRRTFLQVLGGGAAAAVGCPKVSARAAQRVAPEDRMGMLVDTTECVGCRKCEWACNREHGLTDKPLEYYEETGVYARRRRTSSDAYTVVNQYANPKDPEKPIHVKTQCMHCLDAACVSACLVGSLEQGPTGAITYDAWKCIGCRYCMIACPFEIPAYEYENALTPVVSKCTFCLERTAENGAIPACAEMCPPMCLTYGKRSELLALAHEKIAADPDRYLDQVYGEHEAGGTSWLYLAAKPFDEIGLPAMSAKPIAALTETIQHSVFKYGLPPILLFGLLGAAMKVFKPDDLDRDAQPGNHEEEQS
jgi:formate dehydrogenase iron-sulfur subunit